ncbi:hypothetical protein [Sulfuracidifex tepidarius]|uniref:Uncharacterized protein n=1 Tax=Sulfuracidifex tepidarius TaxID=1294262 RepID=A0A510E659_9CREN|nr:hypothetical protein [Sulfuracidifex tepidarius]BBG28023.1 hypothetical protein IC007_2578 [Sulfuracidifex tepidarius]
MEKSKLVMSIMLTVIVISAVISAISFLNFENARDSIIGKTIVVTLPNANNEMLSKHNVRTQGYLVVCNGTKLIMKEPSTVGDILIHLKVENASGPRASVVMIASWENGSMLVKGEVYPFWDSGLEAESVLKNGTMIPDPLGSVITNATLKDLQEAVANKAWAYPSSQPSYMGRWINFSFTYTVYNASGYHISEGTDAFAAGSQYSLYYTFYYNSSGPVPVSGEPNQLIYTMIQMTMKELGLNINPNDVYSPLTGMFY